MEPATDTGETKERSEHTSVSGGFYHCLFKGQELLEKGEVREAREAFADAIALKPDHPEALAGLALASFKLDDFQPSANAYSRLIEVTPGQATLHVNLGIVELKLGQLDSAEANFEKAIELGGDTAKVQNYLGLIYSRRGEYARALDAFRQSGSARMAKQMEEMLEKHRHPGQNASDVEVMVNNELKAAGVDSTPPVKSVPASAEIAPEAPDTAEDADAERRRNILKLGQRGGNGSPTTATMQSGTPAPASTYSRGENPRTQIPATGNSAFILTGPGLLTARLETRICAKLSGLAIVRGGISASEPLYKKFKGRKTNVLFGEASRPVHRLEGTGEAVWSSGREQFHRIVLDGDKIFLNERVLFAFTTSLGWENGRITTGDLEGVHLVNFTGRGEIVLRIEGPMTVVDIVGEQSLEVRADRLLGWKGRIAPRMQVVGEDGIFPSGTQLLQMQGEGSLFVGSA